MSVQNKLGAAKQLSSVLKKWPDDSHKVYSSFREAQLKLYKTSTPSDLPSAETLELRTEAANKLLDNFNASRFAPNPRILKPDGNPMYYNLIMREASGKEAKSSLFTAIYNTIFGWWKK